MKILATPICWNESMKIGRVCDRFEDGLVDKMMVFDDASTDGSPDVVREKGYEVFQQESQQGVGAAIRAAIKYARKEGYDILVVVAGNDKDRPTEIPRLVKPIIEDGYDFVQGSRYLPEGEFGNMPFYRRLATGFVHPLMFTLAARQRITDSTNGFRAIRLSCFDDERINIDQPWLDKYELEPYIFFKFIRLGFKVCEVPVTKIYPPKSLGGYTKMKPITGWWSILKPIFILGLGLKK
ncbi:MAG: dolichol-phosphate mannosyltransferase [Candidatus Omnitrophota bacterium]|jgi:dolichol-phosphate mannosyltransferase